MAWIIGQEVGRHMARRLWERKSGKYSVNELIGLATKQVDLYVSN